MGGVGEKRGPCAYMMCAARTGEWESTVVCVSQHPLTESGKPVRNVPVSVVVVVPVAGARA